MMMQKRDKSLKGVRAQWFSAGEGLAETGTRAAPLETRRESRGGLQRRELGPCGGSSGYVFLCLHYLSSLVVLL